MLVGYVIEVAEHCSCLLGQLTRFVIRQFLDHFKLIQIDKIRAQIL